MAEDLRPGEGGLREKLGFSTPTTWVCMCVCACVRACVCRKIHVYNLVVRRCENNYIYTTFPGIQTMKERNSYS